VTELGLDQRAMRVHESLQLFSGASNRLGSVDARLVEWVNDLLIGKYEPISSRDIDMAVNLVAVALEVQRQYEVLISGRRYGRVGNPTAERERLIGITVDAHDEASLLGAQRLVEMIYDLLELDPHGVPEARHLGRLTTSTMAS
jgi:hypothetical protein